MELFGYVVNPFLLAAVAVIVLFLIIRAATRGRSGEGAEERGQAGPTTGPSSGELVAVIAAAIAAASGRAPGSFNVIGIEPAGGSPGSSFNTPVWGHVDRLGRTQLRG